MAVAPSLNLFSMADSSLASHPISFASKTSSHRLIPLRPNPIGSIRLYCSRSSLSFFFLTKKKIPSVVSLVAQTSDWARQAEEELELEGEEFRLQEVEAEESGLSDWEGDNQSREEGVGEVIAEGDSSEIEGFADAFHEPPEEAKLFVGNLPYDVDSEKLAHLFQEAGIVEVAEVIYNRETDQSRGFGFVTMSTVEEAEKAVEMFNRHDWNGRLLTVNKAAPRGSLPDRPLRGSLSDRPPRGSLSDRPPRGSVSDRPPRNFEPSLRIYVGNLPWQVDDTRLGEVFSEHGKVVSAMVAYDRETGRSRGFGFVTMASKNELDDAIAALDGQSLDGRAIRVNVAEEKPRRSF